MDPFPFVVLLLLRFRLPHQIALAFRKLTSENVSRLRTLNYLIIRYYLIIKLLATSNSGVKMFCRYVACNNKITRCGHSAVLCIVSEVGFLNYKIIDLRNSLLGSSLTRFGP